MDITQVQLIIIALFSITSYVLTSDHPRLSLRLGRIIDAKTATIARKVCFPCNVEVIQCNIYTCCKKRERRNNRQNKYTGRKVGGDGYVYNSSCFQSIIMIIYFCIVSFSVPTLVFICVFMYMHIQRYIQDVHSCNVMRWIKQPLQVKLE